MKYCVLRKIVLATASSVLLWAVSDIARAWDGAPYGEISVIEVTHGQNYGFRVWFSNGASMCTSGAKWAFLNESDSNYKIYVANLMLAKALGKPVALYTVTEGPYCHIGHMSFE